MLDALRKNGRVYLLEAAGLAFFVLAASAATTLLEYPGSPVHDLIASKTARRAVLAVALGLVIVVVTYSPLGTQSGAHINPAVTWAWFWRGKIGGWDALFYTLAQVAGAVAAVHLFHALVGAPYAHEAVDYVVTKPGPAGVAAAFAGEFAIAFVLMLALVAASESRRMEGHAGWIAGALLAVFILVETPLSGMSLNPARSLGPATLAPASPALWLYLVAPTLGALAAVEAYALLGLGRFIPDWQPGPTFPKPAA